MTTSIRTAYHMWPQYNRRLRDRVAAMTEAELAIRPAPGVLPVWAAIGHTAAMRVYWLCEVVGEPGGQATPFWADGTTVDWADDLGRPRGAADLAEALDATFEIIDGCLERWTVEMLTDEIERHYAGAVQVHTRASILQRILTHEAWHAGELSQTLGIHGLEQLDLWRAD